MIEHREHRSSIEDSLKEIMIEKSLIKAGQIEVAQMVTDLKQELNEGMHNLKTQFSQSKLNHAELLKDLDYLHASAIRITEKLTETTEYVLTQNELTTGQFEDTMKHLHDIKTTIFTLSTLLEQVQNGIDSKLNWILDKVGDTGRKTLNFDGISFIFPFIFLETFVSHINIVLTHLTYLLLGMLVIVFVNAAAFYRIFFVSAVVLNFFATILNFYQLNIVSLSWVIFTVFIGTLTYCCRDCLEHLMSGFIFAGKFISQVLLGGYLRNIFALESGANKIGPEKVKKVERVNGPNDCQPNGISDNYDIHTPVRRWLNDNVDSRR